MGTMKEKTRAEMILDLLRQAEKQHKWKTEHDYYSFQSDSYYKRPRTDGRGRNKRR